MRLSQIQFNCDFLHRIYVAKRIKKPKSRDLKIASPPCVSRRTVSTLIRYGHFVIVATNTKE